MKVLEGQIKGVEKGYKPEVQVYAEFLTDLLACLAHESETLYKQFKTDVCNLFYQESFFLMSERTLRKWQIIMRHYLARDQGSQGLFEELLLKYNRAEGLLVSKKWELAQKSLTFKRLAFLVYSSNVDEHSFDEQLDHLLKKMTEGFKSTAKDPEMRMQLFLLSRIIMLRLTSAQLAEALRKLWPHLLAELVSVFDVEPGQKRDYRLTIEGIKIVELMS